LKCLNSFKCREGLSTRTPAASSDEIQLRIDPVGDFDDEITGLRGQVRKLRNVIYLFVLFMHTHYKIVLFRLYYVCWKRIYVHVFYLGKKKREN